MYTVAVIVSAGKGKRISDKTPKQFIKIDGRPLIYYTLSVFDSAPCIDGIVLVAAADKIDYCGKLVKQYNFKKILKIVSGGSTRAESVRKGLSVIPNKTKIVVVHDGVRPFVSQGLIRKVINGAKRHGASITAVVPKSTIKEVRGAWIKKTLERSSLAETQTPQAFKYSVLCSAYQKYKNKLKNATDTSYIVEQAGYKGKIVKSDYSNIKITTKEDLEFVRSIFQPLPERVGIGYDIHRLVRGRSLVLGGVKIKSSAGLLGHSDADVLLHALTDAVLGAVGLRDIGWYFPDTNKRYKGMESKYFLFKAKELMRNKGYRILNIDSIIVAQRPRLQAYYKDMVGNISKWLNLSKNKITVKFCTPEKLGPLGHKKAIASIACVTAGR